MKKRYGLVTFLLIATLLLGGCKTYTIKPEGLEPNPELIQYAPKSTGLFLGDNAYMHQIVGIEIISETPFYEMTLQGEVKLNQVSSKNNEASFDIDLWIDSEKMVQVISPSLFNDSDYVENVLLKMPLEVGASWEYDTLDFAGNAHKIKAEIVKIDKDLIEVVYENSNLGKEARVFKKDNGSVSFSKEIWFDTVKAITGYHKALDPIENQAEVYDQIEPVEISGEIVALLDAFNRAFYSGDVQTYTEWVKEESSAAMKLSSEITQLEEAPRYIGFKVINAVSTEKGMAVTLIEKYDTADGTDLLVVIDYFVELIDGNYFISDFEMQNSKTFE
ncbi:hypothetical protein [Fusibacter tunisiensis]|uniref:Uncharacterized protein n=1 Tax=Fusibacter tunisiensis TaxID=1008308 RepID=A0ABS2MSH6_9FIRM|nr:hypothetical protein [Fusibacter tunisiensis]MBM7562374.1 hypothetical protein [Fusibacter tunisiensis]